MTSDTVLDVERMTRWVPSLGPNVTVETIEADLHGLLLSAVRDQEFATIDGCLRRVLEVG